MTCGLRVIIIAGNNANCLLWGQFVWNVKPYFLGKNMKKKIYIYIYQFFIHWNCLERGRIFFNVFPEDRVCQIMGINSEMTCMKCSFLFPWGGEQEKCHLFIVLGFRPQPCEGHDSNVFCQDMMSYFKRSCYFVLIFREHKEWWLLFKSVIFQGTR